VSVARENPPGLTFSEAIVVYVPSRTIVVRFTRLI